MLSLYQAELQKTVGNRWVTGFLLWIFPIGALGVVIIMAILTLLFDNFSAGFFGNAPQWTSTMISVWTFPTNIIGQMILIGLTATVFAGEYQWGTWKNVIPRQRRFALIGIKFLVLGTLVVFAFVLMSIIMGLGYGVIAAIADVAYGPALTAEVVKEFLEDYTLQAVLAFITVLITAIYAAFTAMLMRSILGGVLVGLVLIIVEPIIATLFLPISYVLEWKNLLHVIRFTPTYNVNNISSWVRFDQPSTMFSSVFDAGGLAIPADGIGFSLIILTTWVVWGIGLILWLFERQDISS